MGKSFFAVYGKPSQAYFVYGKKLNKKLAEKYPPKRYIRGWRIQVLSRRTRESIEREGILMKGHKKGLAVWIAAILLLLIASIIAGAVGRSGSVPEPVSPVLVTAFMVTAVLLIAALLIRVYAIPRLQYQPGKLQLLLEEIVGFFDRLGERIGRLCRGFMNVCISTARFVKERKKELAVWLAAVLLLLFGSIAAGASERSESVQEMMRDAVLHDVNQISLFGLKAVNPGLISAFLVTAVLLIAAVLIRVFAIPRFQYRPGRFQLLLEEAVGFFDGLARGGSPWRYGFMSAYIFGVGLFIFVGTLFELLGLQAPTVGGHSVITLPAPLSDVNAAIATGTLSYLVILSGGIAGNGVRGIGRTLKEFSLPISMSFRLFGALLSGLLVTELVYYYVNLSFVLPVVVGVMFTLLHALIQTYVLVMLVSMYYGEVSEPPHKG